MIESFFGGFAANLFTDALKQAPAKPMDFISKIITFLVACFITACLIACFMQPFKTGNTYNNVTIEQLNMIVVPDEQTAASLAEKINR